MFYVDCGVVLGKKTRVCRQEDVGGEWKDVGARAKDIGGKGKIQARAEEHLRESEEYNSCMKKMSDGKTEYVF